MKILLVENEPSVAGFLHQGLTEQGYTVDLAADGLPGLHRAQNTHYDCLILDQMLPGLSGLEVCRQVRAHNAGVPNFAAHGLGRNRRQNPQPRHGADDFELLHRLEYD